MTKRYWLILIFFLGLTANLPGQQESFLKIDSLELVRSNDTLMFRFSLPDLLSGDVRDAILSGLPVLVEIRNRLESRDQQLVTQQRKFRIEYDIWEDQYMIDQPGEQVVFSSLESLKAFWHPHVPLRLGPARMLEARTEVLLTMELKIILLSHRDGEELKDWIFQADEIEENQPSFERDTGFTLNLDHIVSLFISKEDISKRFSATSRFGPVDPNSLVVMSQKE